MARGRKPNPPVAEQALACTAIVRQLRHHRDALAAAGPPRHGNVRLELVDALVVMLAAFFNPLVRSLRLIEQLSQIPWVKGQLGVERVCRSTLSDAFERFEPRALLPLIRSLMEQVPHLARADGDLEQLCRRVIAADGSYWNIPADVLWALAQNRGHGGGKGAPGGKGAAGGKGKGKAGGRPRGGAGGKTRRAVRVNWQLDVSACVPAGEVSVSGADEGSEPAAFIKQLVAGVIYVVDRNFVHFGFINAVLDKGSDLVLRLRADTRFDPAVVLPLSPADLAAGVVSDRLGTLPGAGRKNGRSRTGPPPARQLREVIVVDPATGQSVRLLTSLLGVPAHVVAAIYRHRWQIELFFRWLKVWGNFDHLFSHGRKGITLQFYVAVIACLMMYLRTGRKPDKYSLFLLGQVAEGAIDFDEIVPMLDRVAREKEQERQRRARKRAPAKKVEQLPA